jgi:uncharacterized Zn-finger protein
LLLPPLAWGMDYDISFTSFQTLNLCELSLISAKSSTRDLSLSYTSTSYVIGTNSSYGCYRSKRSLERRETRTRNVRLLTYFIALDLIVSPTSNPIPPPSNHHLPTNLSPPTLTRTLKSKRSGSSTSARIPPTGSTIEYASSAPLPPSSSNHAQNGEEDEEVPSHLYGRLPKHVLVRDEKGREVPDYLKMILMCESSLGRAYENG